MNTSRTRVTPLEPGSASPVGPRRSRALLALGLLAIGLPAAASEQTTAQEPVAAVWKKEEILFFYRSAIAIYSCDSLRDRVASILYAVGAGPNLEIEVTNCSQSFVPLDSSTIDRARRTSGTGSGTSYQPPGTEVEQLSTVHVQLSMPVEMTPDVIEELKADKSRRELISRVTGNPIPRFDDPVPFAAERRLVTISDKTVGIEAAECELLEQLVTSSFRDLGLRVVGRGYSCDPRRVSNIRPTLTVEALVPVQFEARETQQAPAEAGDDAGSETSADPGDETAEPATDKPPE